MATIAKRYTYLVRAGDTLPKLAKYFGRPQAEIIAANPQVSRNALMTAGTFISLPPAPFERTESLHAFMADVGADDPTPWLDVARRELGVHEGANGVSNPRIIEYLHSVSSLGYPADNTDQTPWCACFMQWVLAQVGIAGTNDALAKSYLNWGAAGSMTDFKIGSVAVFDRPGGGHVGFLTGKPDSTRVMILGGNEGNAVSEETFPIDGGGYKLLALRWPPVPSS